MSEYFLPPSTATAVRRHARTLGGLKREKGGIKWSDTGGSGVTADGWINDTAETWTYASAGSFTVPGNLTAKYSVGTYIKLTQTTLKFFVVSSSSYAAGTTTVNITAGTDYTLANAAITLPFYSYAVNPQGYPGWFNYTITWTGFTATVPTASVSRFAVVGRECYFSLRLSASGTSNATTMTLSLPIPSAVASLHMVYGVDSNASLTAPSTLVFSAAGTTVAAFKDLTGAAWTNANGKSVQGPFIYGI